MRPEDNPKLAVVTIESWARAYIESERLDTKCDPPRPPEAFDERAEPLRLAGPGRPPELEVVGRAPKSRGRGSLARPEARAAMLHTFWHHELQAAELFAWALLAFPKTPEAFRRGLLGIMLEELGHMRLFAREVEKLGFELGAFPVRDWFWQRVPSAATPAAFLALVGLGLEAVNLDYAADFEASFASVGATSAAEAEARVGRDEEAHVRFACKWFAELTGKPLDFDSWCAALPAPLTPLMFRAKQPARGARLRAGLSPAFIDALEAWRPTHS